MFTQVTRYLGIRVFISILLTEFTLVGLAATIKAVEQLSKLGVGDFTVHTLALYVGFSMPQEAVILISNGRFNWLFVRAWAFSQHTRSWS